MSSPYTVAVRRSSRSFFVYPINRSRALVSSIRDVCQRATQVCRVVGRNDRLAVRELEGWNAAPGGIVNPGDRFIDIVRAQLRLVRQLLESVVVPEFHLDAAIQRPSLCRFV